VTITHDANTRFPATDGTTGVNSSDTTTGDRTFSHSGSASAKGAVVVLICTGNTTTVSGVLYGGTAMTLVQTANDTTEAGRVEVYALVGRSGIVFPTGTQTVTLQGCTATAKFAACSTVTASLPLTAVNASNFKDTTTAANPTLTVTTTAPTLLYGGLHGGAADPASYVVGTGYTSQYNNDWGALAARASRRTSEVASGAVVYDFSFVTSDDYCIAAAALSEVSDPNSYAAGAVGNGPMF
jgi:hypothetical protein